LFGNSLQGGIIGNNPLLPASATVNDNIPMQFDFRALYASLLEKWLGVDPAVTASVLLKDYSLLPLIHPVVG
jgi:uncharacterized protein (DUF1501 family)